MPARYRREDEAEDDAKKAEGAEEGSEVEEQAFKIGQREDEDAEGEGEEEERGEKGKRVSDRRLKDELRGLDGALDLLR